MEPGPKSLDSSYTEDCGHLASPALDHGDTSPVEATLPPQPAATPGHNAQRGASRSEVKLSNGETQHIGEVYQLLLSFVGEIHFEAVIDPLRQGSGLIQGNLENSVYVGHSLGFSAGKEEATGRP